jgi:hypothetical protein
LIFLRKNFTWKRRGVALKELKGISSKGSLGAPLAAGTRREEEAATPSMQWLVVPCRSRGALRS